MRHQHPTVISSRAVRVPIGSAHLDGDLTIPVEATGIVIFAHGSGSSRHSPRNRHVAAMLQHRGFATLLIDLLTEREEELDEFTGEYRFDIGRLADRLVAVSRWVGETVDTASLAIGFFGASTGAGAALVAAAELPAVAAVVSRGGRPDLAGAALGRVNAPTLLIVGGRDTPVIQMNRDAMAQMRAPVSIEIVPGATHLFEEPGALDRVAGLAADWFERYLSPTDRVRRSGP
jgi:dienelactone hydrolase